MAVLGGARVEGGGVLQDRAAEMRLPYLCGEIKKEKGVNAVSDGVYPLRISAPDSSVTWEYSWAIRLATVKS